MSALPWLKLYVALWRTDTENLSPASRGAHIDLACARWLGRELPDDDVQLARAARMTPDEWAFTRDELLRDLWRITDGRWRWPWLEEQVDKATDYVAKQRGRSRLGVDARLGRRADETNRADDRTDDHTNDHVADQTVDRADNPSKSDQIKEEQNRSTQHQHQRDDDAELRAFEEWFDATCQRVSGKPRIARRNDRETLRRLLAEGHDIADADFRRRVELIVLSRNRSHGDAPASLAYVATSLENGGAQ